MKNTKNLLLCITILLTVLAFCMPAFAAGENLWYDGGFDNVTVNASNQAQSDEYRTLLGDWRNYLINENGNNFITVAGSNAGQPAFSNASDYPLSPDASLDYVLTIKLKNESAGTASSLAVFNENTYMTTNWWTLTEKVIFEATDEWQTYTLEFPKGTLKPYIYFRSLSGRIAIDDISICKVVSEIPDEPVEVNYWPNEKFDDVSGLYFKAGAPTWWNNVAADPAGGTNMTMKFSSNGPFISNDEALDLVIGGTYQLSFRVYGTADTAHVGVYTSADKSNKDNFYPEKHENIASVTTTTATEWNTYSYEFVASDATKFITFYVNNYTIYLDDVKIEKIELIETSQYEPYTLSYNEDHSDRGWYRSGPHGGWVLDNRGGHYNTVNAIDYNVFSDTSTQEAVSFYKNLNKVDEGIVTLETVFEITSGCDGFKLRFDDENGDAVYSLETVGGKFKTLKSSGAYRTLCNAKTSQDVHVLVKLDFDKKMSHTYINDEYYGTDALMSDNIMRFSYMTGKEETVSVKLSGTTKITANYYVHDDFLYYTSTGKTLPYDYTSSDSDYAYISASEGHVGNSASLLRTLDTNVSGEIAFEGKFYASSGAAGSFKLLNGDNQVIDFSFDGTNIISSTEVVYSSYRKDFWHKFRIEADLANHTADIKINGRKVKTISLPESYTTVSALEIVSDSTAEFIFDDIKLFSLIEHDDYVPEPVLPGDDKYAVGINVCSLWSYESTHSWANIAPFEEFKPVLGYYDEGNPEVADWEIKMLSEHGVDFQAFCWAADRGDGPIKTPTNLMALHDGYMNAKYSDKMKYALIWTAGGVPPSSVQAMYDYFVPYWIENYFKDDRYMTVDGKLIMYIYNYGALYAEVCGRDAGKLVTMLNTVKSMVKEETGKELLILSTTPSPSGSTFAKSCGLDGESAYHWGADGYSWEHTKSGIMAASSVSGAVWTVPTLSTGFNNLPWREGGRYPNMSVSDFKTGLKWIRDSFFDTYQTTANWQKNLIMLSNWNEYGEGTYIMPSGLNGFGYLEAVREVLTDGSNASTHTDYELTEAQLERIGKNYPQYYKLIRRTYTEEGKNTVSDGKLYVDGMLISSTLLPERTSSGKAYYPFDTYWSDTDDINTSIVHYLRLHFEWDWDWENGKLTLLGKDDTYAEFTVGSATVNYHDGTIILSDPVYMRDGVPMLDMEAVCNIFGFKYAYKNNNMYITTAVRYSTDKNFWANETFDTTDGLYLKSGAPDWWSKVEADPDTSVSANNVMKFAGNGAFIANAQSLELLNGKKYTISFRAYGTAETSKMMVRLSAKQPYPTWFGFSGAYTDVATITPTTPKTWETYEYEFTASNTTRYLSFYVPQDYQTFYLDDVKIVEISDLEQISQIVAAGLKEKDLQNQSVAFATYIADKTCQSFGFEVSSEEGKTLLVDATGKVVASNGEFCGLDELNGDFYMVSVNGIPKKYFDYDITVRAYAIFNNHVIYSNAVTVNVNDILSGAADMQTITANLQVATDSTGYSSWA